ncbi:unnamed protein product [Prunus armeniaca]
MVMENLDAENLLIDTDNPCVLRNSVQVAIAMFLLYDSLGAAVITSVVGIMCVLVFVVLGTRRNKRFQSNVMKCRDSRMKATNDMLNYMHVIKFQAWEEHFNKRIQAFR